MEIELPHIPNYCPCCQAREMSKTTMYNRMPSGLWELVSHRVKYECGAELRIAYDDIVVSEGILDGILENKHVITRYVLGLCSNEGLTKLGKWRVGE